MKKELEEKAKSTKDAIDKLVGLSDEEKAKGKAEIDKLLETGLTNIQKAENEADAGKELTTSKGQMDDVYNGLVTDSNKNIEQAKEKATSELTKKAEEAKKAIDALTNLSDEEKAKQKAKVDKDLEAGTKAINDAKTPEAITTAQTKGENNIEKEVKDSELQDTKNKMKKELEEKAKSTKDAIDKLVGLSDEEKVKGKAEIDKLLETGLTNIQKAENETDAGKELTTSKGQMDDVYNGLVTDSNKNIEQAKEKATAELTKKAEEAKKAIDALTNLSDEEKAKQIAEVDKDLETGTKAINDATTPEGITTAQTKGENNIEKEVKDSELQDAKNKAKKELVEKAKSTKDAIDKLVGLSDEEKVKGKAEIDKLLETGLTNIQKAENEADAWKELTTSKGQMDDVYNGLVTDSNKNIEQAKEKATAELKTKAEEAKKAIDALMNLSEEEKAKQKAKVDKDLEAGTKAINEATTPEGITTAQKTGESNIEKEVTDSELQDAKNKAKKELEDKAKSTKDAIDKLVGLSDEEKVKGKAEIDKLLETGLTNIQKAENETDAGKELTTSKGQMDDVYNGLVTDSNKNIEQAKEKATSELTKKAEEAKKAIDALTNLSDEEKAKQIAEVDKDLETGTKAINDATTPEGITTAQATGEGNIEKEVTDSKLQNTKNAAKKELEEKAKSTKVAIDKLTGVSAEEKEKAKSEIEKVLEAGLKAITDANSSEDVATQTTDHKGQMDTIYNNLVAENDKNIEQAKEKAIAELTKKSEEAKKAIDALTNLSDEEKAKQKAEVDKELEAGKKAINEAVTPEAITTAQTTGEGNINKEVTDSKLQDTKNKGKKELEDKAKSTKDAIDKLVGLSDEEKEKGKAEIDKLLETGLTNIDKAENADAVTTQVTTSKGQMDDVYNGLVTDSNKNIEQAKEKATAELKTKAEEAKKAIDALTNLSDEEKAKQKAEVDKDLEAGTKAINEATTPEGITTAQATGEGNIEKEVTDSKLQDAKNKAKKELEDKATSTKAAIDKLTGISTAEKEKAKAEIDKLLATGLAGIDKAKDATEVTAQVTTSKGQMDDIYNGLVAESNKNIEQAKEKATAELTKKAEEAKKAIDALTNLSDEEKAKQKAEVDKELEAGKKAINEATTLEGITTAQTKGEGNIDKEVTDSKLQDAKNKGKKELKEKATSTKDAIDKLVGLSEEEKAKAKTEIDKLLETGLTNIDKAENADAVTTQVTTSKGQMDDVYNGLVTDSNKNIEQAKEKATSELTKKAEEAKKVIDALTNLSDEEKAKQKAEVDKELEAGKKAINEATTPEGITTAQTKGEANIEKVVTNSKLQDAKNAAKKELKEKAELTKKAIDKLTNLSDKEKEAAKSEIDKLLEQGLKAIEESVKLEDIAKELKDSKKQMDTVYNKLLNKGTTGGKGQGTTNVVGSSNGNQKTPGSKSRLPRTNEVTNPNLAILGSLLLTTSIIFSLAKRNKEVE
ncbi:DUF1542 domain-containing protein [Vagococcus hydrophili]|uniref:DUF1542 domain-containing protein n=1 Tax=Vagococcus hydrophili TaxID=2714947 RepID=A0A6G8AT85_9ENTE|nr:DUF1542 domain-containing protein [Vagococcus hydrophili]QIL48291.1 DUF1542 domain-containing protein [Vagococcus hydrophili]